MKRTLLVLTMLGAPAFTRLEAAQTKIWNGTTNTVTMSDGVLSVEVQPGQCWQRSYNGHETFTVEGTSCTLTNTTWWLDTDNVYFCTVASAPALVELPDNGSGYLYGWVTAGFIFGLSIWGYVWLRRITRLTVESAI